MAEESSSDSSSSSSGSGGGYSFGWESGRDMNNGATDNGKLIGGNVFADTTGAQIKFKNDAIPGGAWLLIGAAVIVLLMIGGRRGK